MQTMTGWRIDVDRGPAWLFMQMHPPTDPSGEQDDFADCIWALASAHFTYRVVLEFDNVGALPGELVEQLEQLQNRLQSQGGLLRLSGLSDPCQQTLASSRLAENLKHFPNRACAVKAHCPVEAH